VTLLGDQLGPAQLPRDDSKALESHAAFIGNIITYLAAQATQSPSGDPNAAPPLVKFDAQFGPGFYWFAAYCLFALASQQYTAWRVRASLDKSPADR
jgi:hypothetical protein